jgi:glycosyltransferase involved in cell wall biosynthesis
MHAAVSVVIPAYNAAAYLDTTIQGVLDQTFSDWELIVVDNASTDDTGAILDRLLATEADGRIRVARNPRTVPAPDNWNIAVSLAHGRYMKLLCADDVLTKDCLERQVRALDHYPSATLAAGSRIVINSRGKQLFIRNGIGRTGIYNGREMIRRCIMAGTNIIGDPVNVMWRRSAMEQVGVFDPEVVYCTDVEYWLRLLSTGDLYYDALPVGFYRIHSQAAATGLAGVTVDDFERAARKQVARGTVSLSRSDIRFLRTKSWVQSKMRQAIYRWLG